MGGVVPHRKDSWLRDVILGVHIPRDLTCPSPKLPSSPNLLESRGTNANCSHQSKYFPKTAAVNEVQDHIHRYPLFKYVQNRDKRLLLSFLWTRILHNLSEGISLDVNLHLRFVKIFFRADSESFRVIPQSVTQQICSQWEVQKRWEIPSWATQILDFWAEFAFFSPKSCPHIDPMNLHAVKLACYSKDDHVVTLNSEREC